MPKSRFLPTVKAKILENTRDGMPRQHAAALAGVSRQALLGWLRRGREADQTIPKLEDLLRRMREQGPTARDSKGRTIEDVERLLHSEEEFAEFAADMDTADAEAMKHHIDQITAHAQGDWRASAFILKHRFPKEFGDRKDEEEKDKGPIQINFNVVEPVDRTHLMEQAQQARAQLEEIHSGGSETEADGVDADDGDEDVISIL